jgi:hypothetical protein
MLGREIYSRSNTKKESKNWKTTGKAPLIPEALLKTYEMLAEP